MAIDHSSDAANRYRWRLLVVLWFIVAVVVALPGVGSGVLNARMVADLQLDRGLYGAAFGLFVVMMSVPAPLVAAGGVIHLHDLGFTPARAASTIAVLVSASLVGNLLAGALGDRVPPHRIGAVAMLALLLGLLLGIHPRTEAGLLAFAVPLGPGYGASQVCLMSLLANYYGARPFAALFGMLLAIGTLAAALLADGAGALFEQLHTYAPSFQLCAALTAVGLICIAAAAPPREAAPARV
jgi:MFS family permease